MGTARRFESLTGSCPPLASTFTEPAGSTSSHGSRSRLQAATQEPTRGKPRLVKEAERSFGRASVVEPPSPRASIPVDESPAALALWLVL